MKATGRDRKNYEDYKSGRVFEITAAGKSTSLHTIDGTDGSDPFLRTGSAARGDFYAATQFVRADGGGTVFGLGVGLGPFAGGADIGL